MTSMECPDHAFWSHIVPRAAQAEIAQRVLAARVIEAAAPRSERDIPKWHGLYFPIAVKCVRSERGPCTRFLAGHVP